MSEQNEAVEMTPEITQTEPAGQLPAGPMPEMASYGKAKHSGKAIAKLLRYCGRYIVPISIAMILAIAGAVLSIIGPEKLGDMTNLISAPFESLKETGVLGVLDVAAVVDIAVLLLILYSLSALFNYIQGYIMASVTQVLSKSLRKDISGKINVLPLRYFDSTSYGDILSRVTNDVDTIGQTLSQSIISFISSVVLFFGVIIMMFTINWIMALTAIGSSLIGFVLMMLIMSKSQKYFMSQQVALGEINGHVEEVYSGHNVVKVFNGGEEAKGKFEKINKKLFTSVWKSQFLSGLMMPLMGFVGNLGYVAVCVVGAALAFDGKISFGVIISFTLYVRLFTQPLSQIAQTASSLQSTAAASERVFEFLEEKELETEEHKNTWLENVRGDIEFKNVQFGYNEERVIIHDFSAKAEAGQKIAIVGPTGAGKTTMVNLLMRFYEVNSGEILIDDVPIQELTRENVHALFGMVLQDTWLFEGTVRENIVYGKPDVSEEELTKACRAAGIDHFIRTLPHGYDTVLDDKANLSQGQKQLFTIARAMIENAPMLILDEATSSVDTRTEILIQEAMDRLMQGRTSFVIAHRLSTIKNADLILVMRDGDIVESGNHEQLLEKGGFYAELYNSQFSEE